MRHVALGDTFYFKFTTRDFDTGAPQTLGGTPVISAYEDANATQITTGITLTADYDSVTGLNHVAVVASSGNGYESGKYYAFVITTGTVDTVSVVGEVVHEIVIGPVDANVEEIDTQTVTAAGAVTVNAELGASATAMNNFEDAFDTTGYGFTNCTIPTVTTLTGHTAQTGDNYARLGAPAGASIAADIADIPTVSEFNARTLSSGTGESYFDPATDGVNVTQISGDTTAANNLEAAFDGTGLAGDNYPPTQLQVLKLASGSAAMNTVARSSPDGFVITTGTGETGTEDNTHELDGTTHDLEDSAGTTDCYYVFDIGASGVPVSCTWQGAVNAGGDTWGVYAYNWGGTAWEQIGDLDGSDSSSVITETFNLTSAHVGTGGNVGLVRLRFYSTDGTQVSTDRVLCSYINDVSVSDILTTQMTESYASDGTAPTLAQSLFAIQQFLQEKVISGSVLSVKQLDGSTEAMSFTLTGSPPTSLTRAS